MKIHWKRTPAIILMAVLFACRLSAQPANPADSTGLPGDHFNLEAALALFKKAESPEHFEKMLNTEDNDVNNLDLNEDGQIDYVRIIDRVDGDAHAIVLQVPLSASEAQDIAVIEIEKNGAESATLQIVGDEAIYGQALIAEPFQEEAGQKSGRGGPVVHLAPDYIVVNVWSWPTVRYIYRPTYVVYVSPWRWAAFPTWWRPFRPRPWGHYHARVRPHRAHYHVVTTHRVVRAHKVYSGHRKHSTVVHSRTVTHVNKNGRHSKPGQVQATKTTKKTTVHGKRGGSVTKKQTNTKVQGKQGGPGGRRGRQ